MKKGLSVHRENVSVFLSILVVLILTTNFVTAHQLTQPHELRFLVNSIILGLIALFLRFGLMSVAILPLHRSLYRTALVMSFWSLCFYFMPFPNMVIYLIPLPGFYFLFRIESKKTRIEEDIIATGVLFAFGTFLYTQQQPLQAVLFPGQSFDWINYYSHSPVIILLGVGFLRLNKHSNWKGLTILGVLLVIFGAVLLSSFILKPLFPDFIEIVCTIFFLHLSQIYFNTYHGFSKLFKTFTNISDQDYKNLSVILYLLSVITMQVCIFFLIFQYGGNFVAIATIVAALGLLLYGYRDIAIQVFIIEAELFFLLEGSFFFKSHGLLWSIPIGIILLLSVLLRCQSRLNCFINNEALSVSVLIYYLLILQFSLLNPTGFFFIMFPFLCWSILPERPFAVERKYHFAFWPVISLLILLCSMGYTTKFFFNTWGLLNLFVPLAVYLIIQTETIRNAAGKINLIFIRDWSEGGQQALFSLAYISLAICITGFVAVFPWYLADWIPVLLTCITLIACAGIFMGYGLKYKRLSFIIQTEIFFWIILACIRWKLEMQEVLELGSPIDGYFLISIAVLIAGLREIFNKKIPGFMDYYKKTIFIYGLMGWIYLQVVQLFFKSHLTGTFHHAELSSIIMAGISLWLSRAKKNVHVIFIFVFINAAMFFYFITNDCTNLMFYIFPSMSSILILTQVFKEELGHVKIKQIRFVVSLILCGTASFYNIMDFDSSIWFPVIATLISTLLVVAGISLQVRIFLYLGMLFFIVNCIGVVANIIINQPPENVTLFIGVLFLIAGVCFIISFLLFQMKRQQIIDKYHSITEELRKWE